VKKQIEGLKETEEEGKKEIKILKEKLQEGQKVIKDLEEEHEEGEKKIVHLNDDVEEGEHVIKKLKEQIKNQTPTCPKGEVYDSNTRKCKPSKSNEDYFQKRMKEAGKKMREMKKLISSLKESNK